MGAIDDLTEQLHAAAEAEGDPADRTAAVTALRERINDLVGEADRLLGHLHNEREAGAAQVHRQRLEARETAGLREAVAVDPEALDAAGVLSHDELDRLREEGLEGEALERLAELDG